MSNSRAPDRTKVPVPDSEVPTAPVSASMAVLLPDEPLPVRLMNTVWADRRGIHDVLTTRGNLRAWLTAVDADQVRADPGPGDLEQFRALRDALRRLAALLTADNRPTAATCPTDVDKAVADVNDAAARAPAWPALTYRDGELRRGTAGHATAVQRMLSTIAQQAIDLFTGEPRGRLRACYAPGCVLYFVKDHPRREWCSIACGNRTRAARHYQRHRNSSIGD